MVDRDTVDYRDTGSFDDSSLQDVQTIKSAILHKQYGKDVRSALAQLPDSLIKLFGDTGGNRNAEVEEARGGFETLGLHEQAQNAGIDKVTVEVQNARTNSSSKTYPTLKERMDNQENDLNNSINDKLSQISSVPETFANLSALQVAYPNGKTGLFVTADTGHKYIWTNGSWADAGVYQSVGFADGSVKFETVDYIGLENIQDNFLNDSKIKTWNTANPATKPTVINHIINYKGELNHDDGFMVHATMRSPLRDDETLYLNFDYVTDRVGDITRNQSAVYLMDDDGKFFNGKVISLAPDKINQISVSRHVQIKLKNSMYGINIPRSFNILFATQSDYNLTINSLVLNKTNNTKDFSSELIELNTDKFKNHPVDLSNFNKWNTGTGDKATLLSDGSLLISRASSGNSGVSFDCEIDVNNDLYVTSNIIGNKYAVWLMDTTNRLITSVADLYTVKKFGDVFVSKVTKEQLKSYGLTNNTLRILVSVPGINSAIIKELTVSNQAGVGTNRDSINRIIENDGYRKQSFIGQQTEKVPSLVTAGYAGLMYGGYKRTSGFDGILKEITAYVPSAGSYKFTVANLDQYNLIVNNTDFTLSLVAGLNRLDLETKNISIKANQMLLMDLSTAGVFTPDSNGILEPTILQDSNHTVNQDGHGGNQLFNSDKIVPFSYSVIDKTTISKLDDLGEEVNELNNGLAEIIPLKNRILISAPNGLKYKLVVDNSGALSTVSAVPNKVLIIGNSLTLEKGGIGMAASDGNHDYYQLVKNYILSANPNAKVADRTSFAVWEMAENTANRDALFNDKIKPLLASDTDMVIVQLGDNVNTDARHATFANDVDKIIKNIRSVSPKATVIWVGSWFISYPTLMGEIKTAVENNGALLADITKYRNDKTYQSYIGATRTGIDGVSFKVSSQGEASHPGDLGHKVIADAIIANFDF